MSKSADNPMGTDGFEFVEYTAPDPQLLRSLFERLGFPVVARHRSKNVTLHRQGEINFIINAEPASFAQGFARAHGPSACAMAFRVRDAAQAYSRALALGAQPGPQSAGPMELNIPCIEGIGGSLIYLGGDLRNSFSAVDGRPRHNLAAFDGPRAWQDAVTGHPSEASRIAVAVAVLVPLLWHTVWGLARIGRWRGASVGVPTFSNLRFVLQRLSALGLLLFLGAHLWLAWIQPRFVAGRAEPFAEIAREMRHHLPTLAVYLLGILAVAYHLANGIWSFAMGWGLAVGKTALDWMERLAMALFVLFLALGWTAVYALWRAG